MSVRLITLRKKNEAVREKIGAAWPKRHRIETGASAFVR